MLFDLTRATLARGVALEYVDTGGGFGIDYGKGCPLTPADFVRHVRKLSKEYGISGLRHLVEPGRSLVGAHGVLLARVLQHKSDRPTGETGPERRWLMIDAGMNDLMRPALYQSNHRVVPLEVPPEVESLPVRVVGPVCESSDDFGVHDLPRGLEGYVALLDAGAYGFSMASRYNGRALPAEVFVRASGIVAESLRANVAAWAEERLSVHERG